MLWRSLALALGIAMLGLPAALAEEATDSEPQSVAEQPAVGEGTEKPAEKPSLPDPPGLTRLAMDYDIWLDMKRKAVVIDGQIVLREGELEMFACPKGTKEHESIVAVNVRPQFVHAGLLAVGAKPGTPVKFDPKYTPATGQVIDVFVLWKDEAGKNQKVRAQEWIKHVKTGKTMPYNWVFAGSGFWTDDDGKEYYYADGGDLICVSNFPSATLDLPVESTQAADGLLFVADTEKIPPKGTKVRLVLIPRVEKEAKASE
jgi:hypothetical protein